jgi:hypothetical protein
VNWNQVTGSLNRNRSWLIPVGAGLLGFISGTTTGASFVLWKKTRETEKNLEGLAEVVEQARRQAINLDEGFETKVLEMAEQIIYHGTAKQYHEEGEAPPELERQIRDVVREEDQRVRVNAFTTSHDDEGLDEWDWNEENGNRSPDVPYVITAEEYGANELDFRQTSLTWYEGDEVLTDEKDTPIYDVPTTVGEMKFGHGSHDQSICYVRNEKLRAEYEVILDHGSFQVQVMGQDIEEELEKREIRHSHGAPKFRRD